MAIFYITIEVPPPYFFANLETLQQQQQQQQQQAYSRVTAPIGPR